MGHFVIQMFCTSIYIVTWSNGSSLWEDANKTEGDVGVLITGDGINSVNDIHRLAFASCIFDTMQY